MKQDEAEKLARLTIHAMQREQSAVCLSWADVRALCDHILSGDMKCEIENAAYEQALLSIMDGTCDSLSEAEDRIRALKAREAAR